MKVAPLFQKASASLAQVRQDPSIRVTLNLLLGVFVLGLLSALGGYFFGHQSLRGVTQPDMNPFVEGASPQGKYPRQGTFLLKESAILTQVERETKGIAKAGEAKKSSPSPSAQSKTEKGKPSPKAEAKQAKSLPIAVKSQGVYFNVRSLEATDGGIALDVEMRNDGAQSVQFLYDFLDISDDQSQFLSSEVKGLPTNFPPKSEAFRGVIKVSGVSQTQTKWIAIELSDYPDQKVELKIPKISVEK